MKTWKSQTFWFPLTLVPYTYTIKYFLSLSTTRLAFVFPPNNMLKVRCASGNVRHIQDMRFIEKCVTFIGLSETLEQVRKNSFLDHWDVWSSMETCGALTRAKPPSHLFRGGCWRLACVKAAVALKNDWPLWSKQAARVYDILDDRNTCAVWTHASLYLTPH